MSSERVELLQPGFSNRCRKPTSISDAISSTPLLRVAISEVSERPEGEADAHSYIALHSRILGTSYQLLGKIHSAVFQKITLSGQTKKLGFFKIKSYIFRSRERARSGDIYSHHRAHSKAKLSRYRPEKAREKSGRLRPWIFLTFGTRRW